MSTSTSVYLLCEGDSAEKSRLIWESICRRASREHGIRASGEFSPKSWNRFHWRDVLKVAVRSFEGTHRMDGTPVPDVPNVELRYEPEPFREAAEAGDDTSLARTAVELLDLAEFAYGATADRPSVAYGAGKLHSERLSDGEMPPPVTREGLAEDRIEYACWLMVFSPAMVDIYGRETILAAPAWQTEALDDGGVAVLATQDPTTPSKPEARAIDQHLGLDPPAATDEHQY